LTAQISEQTTNVVFLFFSSYSSVICNFIYCICSYLTLPEKYLYQTMQMGFVFFLRMSQDKCNRGYFQYNVIDCIVILFRNRNRNRLHLWCNHPMSGYCSHVLTKTLFTLWVHLSVLQPFSWRCAESAIHHERGVREE